MRHWLLHWALCYMDLHGHSVMKVLFIREKNFKYFALYLFFIIWKKLSVWALCTAVAMKTCKSYFSSMPETLLNIYQQFWIFFLFEHVYISGVGSPTISHTIRFLETNYLATSSDRSLWTTSSITPENSSVFSMFDDNPWPLNHTH